MLASSSKLRRLFTTPFPLRQFHIKSKQDLSAEEIQKAIDPKAFVKKEPSYEYRELPKEGEVEQKHIMDFMAPFPNRDNDIGKEYGFKIKGLEPTRYGDWERKGRCTDF